MKTLVLAAMGVAVLAPAVASAQFPGAYTNSPFNSGDQARPTHDEHDAAHIRRELRKLQKKAVRLQAEDGGRLSEAHRAELEAELAALQRRLVKPAKLPSTSVPAD